MLGNQTFGHSVIGPLFAGTIWNHYLQRIILDLLFDSVKRTYALLVISVYLRDNLLISFTLSNIRP